jgi:hypothetical protein
MFIQEKKKPYLLNIINRIIIRYKIIPIQIIIRKYIEEINLDIIKINNY